MSTLKRVTACRSRVLVSLLGYFFLIASLLLPAVEAQTATIVLDPGHGGKDGGAGSGNAFAEKQFTLMLAQKIAALLGERHRIELTRTADIELSPADRAAVANHMKADLMVSLHAAVNPYCSERTAAVYTHSAERLAMPSATLLQGALDQSETSRTEWNRLQDRHRQRSIRDRAGVVEPTNRIVKAAGRAVGRTVVVVRRITGRHCLGDFTPDVVGIHVGNDERVTHQVAREFGYFATFMPKPVVGDNGNGMHVHQSLFKGKKNLFYDADDEYNLSTLGKQYIAGVMRHAPEFTSITNQWVNSYKRLVPGFEAPVMLAYSARNRSASIRIPHVSSPKARRIEVRFGDNTANPYLCFSAMLMAGLDGIKNKIDPGAAADKDLYDLPPEEEAKIPQVAFSFDEALKALDEDRAFLTEGGVFDDDVIDGFIELKSEEVQRYRASVHPCEFDMYYSV